MDEDVATRRLAEIEAARQSLRDREWHTIRDWVRSLTQEERDLLDESEEQWRGLRTLQELQQYLQSLKGQAQVD